MKKTLLGFLVGNLFTACENNKDGSQQDWQKFQDPNTQQTIQYQVKADSPTDALLGNYNLIVTNGNEIGNIEYKNGEVTRYQDLTPKPDTTKLGF